MQTLSVRPELKGLCPLPRYQISFKFPDRLSVSFNPTLSRCSLIQNSHVKFSKGDARSVFRLRPIEASAAAQPSPATEKWVFQFVGDGDTSHIGKAISPPSTFELTSDAVIIGRLPEKADIVIPVATVSGLHARLEKKEGMLVVTDLNSTNGTYIDDKKLSPGVAAFLSPQSCITFGDIHLAKFQFSRVEISEPIIEVETSNKQDSVTKE